MNKTEFTRGLFEIIALATLFTIGLAVYVLLAENRSILTTF